MIHAGLPPCGSSLTSHIPFHPTTAPYASLRVACYECRFKNRKDSEAISPFESPLSLGFENPRLSVAIRSSKMPLLDDPRSIQGNPLSCASSPLQTRTIGINTFSSNVGSQSSVEQRPQLLHTMSEFYASGLSVRRFSNTVMNGTSRPPDDRQGPPALKVVHRPTVVDVSESFLFYL
jgi:hypothetical protein